MCGNRVEELESRVQELEASVEGLTDELVECKVRLRELESAVDEDIGFGPSDAEAEEEKVDTTNGCSVGAEMVDADSADPLSDPEAAAEASKTEGDNTEDTTEESESDIIVA